MTKKDAEALIHCVDPESLHCKILTAFRNQIEAYVKPNLGKIKPDILIIGPGICYVDEAWLWATEYTNGSVTVVEPDKQVLADSIALAPDIYKAKVKHAPIKIAAEERVEEIQREFNILSWRNPPMHSVSEETIHHCLSSVANNGIAYFTSSEPTSYSDLLLYVSTYNKEGTQLELLHPTPEEFIQHKLPEAPVSMQIDGGGFPDTYILAIRVKRSFRRQNVRA